MSRLPAQTELPRALVGMPNYDGKAVINASRAFFRASDKPFVKYHPTSSLLAGNFNEVWCAALNEVHEGRPLDYFGMLHPDVSAEDGWFDTLVEEMLANDLDVLGLAVGIKDSRGMTSLALGRSDDDWNPLCRLSMRDVHLLPPTFTSDDLGHPLLLNTGCWVCRWRQDLFAKLPPQESWNGSNLIPCLGPHFEIKDRIVFNKFKNRFQAQTEPEDWNFSRKLHRLGLRLGATRKVRCEHVGEALFPNYHPWGRHPFDVEVLNESPVPKVDRDGFRFPRDVEGWLTYDEGKELWRLATCKRVLEFGSYFGLSTICLAQLADHVTSVDPHDGRGTAIPQRTYETFIANLERYGVRGKVNAIIGTSTDPHNWDQYDLIFIDGAHDYESVTADIGAACEMLAPGGLLVFHDYHSARDPDVTRAVDEFVNSGGELLSTHDSLAVVRPPAAIPLEV